MSATLGRPAASCICTVAPGLFARYIGWSLVTKRAQVELRTVSPCLLRAGAAEQHQLGVAVVVAPQLAVQLRHQLLLAALRRWGCTRGVFGVC